MESLASFTGRISPLLWQLCCLTSLSTVFHPLLKDVGNLNHFPLKERSPVSGRWWGTGLSQAAAASWAYQPRRGRGRLSGRKFIYFIYGRGCPSLYPVLSSVFLDHWSNIRLACLCLSSSGHFPSVFPAPFPGHTTAGNKALLSTGAQVCGTGRVLGVWV